MKLHVARMNVSLAILLFLAKHAIVHGGEAGGDNLRSSKEVKGGGSASFHVQSWRQGGKSLYVKGNLGNIYENGQAGIFGKAFGKHHVAKEGKAGKGEKDHYGKAKAFLEGFIKLRLGATGRERIISQNRPKPDRGGRTHFRFTEEINGLPLAGASMMIHAKADGTVYAINGEFSHDDVDLPTDPTIEADDALGFALYEAVREVPEIKHGDWVDDASLTYVLGRRGETHLAYSRRRSYTLKDGRPQRDVIYASAEDGVMVARHPEIFLALSMETRDCEQGTTCDKVVSRAASPINTGDQPIDSAHNYAIATYNYFLNNFGRDSIDDNGMTLISRVHYDSNYNNAFWDGTQMTYGDGDGVNLDPLSKDADVVAHELTHGITERTSSLVYWDESGALNEAMSDVFGAMVDRQEGATGDDIWFIGEDIYTPNIPGDAMRNMANPNPTGVSYRFATGSRDYYPERYRGWQDNRGVHMNSGIANLAFFLLVEGGRHPRDKTDVEVQGIGFDAAADIFYYANIECLTSGATFEEARDCTAQKAEELYASEGYVDNVHHAWDAVGVPGSSAGNDRWFYNNEGWYDDDVVSLGFVGRTGAHLARGGPDYRTAGNEARSYADLTPNVSSSILDNVNWEWLVQLAGVALISLLVIAGVFYRKHQDGPVYSKNYPKAGHRLEGDQVPSESEDKQEISRMVMVKDYGALINES